MAVYMRQSGGRVEVESNVHPNQDREELCGRARTSRFALIVLWSAARASHHSLSLYIDHKGEAADSFFFRGLRELRGFDSSRRARRWRWSCNAHIPRSSLREGLLAITRTNDRDNAL